jgi:hypothetical protein
MDSTEVKKEEVEKSTSNNTEEDKKEKKDKSGRKGVQLKTPKVRQNIANISFQPFAVYIVLDIYYAKTQNYFDCCRERRITNLIK